VGDNYRKGAFSCRGVERDNRIAALGEKSPEDEWTVRESSVELSLVRKIN
jgi:hypothetical protein